MSGSSQNYQRKYPVPHLTIEDFSRVDAMIALSDEGQMAITPPQAVLDAIRDCAPAIRGRLGKKSAIGQRCAEGAP